MKKIKYIIVPLVIIIIAGLFWYNREKRTLQKEEKSILSILLNAEMYKLEPKALDELDEKEMLEEIKKPRESTYTKIEIDNITLPKITNIKNYESLTKYEKELNEIITVIKSYEKNFNSSDYKVTFSMYHEESQLAVLSFFYYINGIIQTNKVYSIELEAFEVTNLFISGVKTKNLENISTTNEKDLLNKIKTFEKNKEIILKNRMSHLFDDHEKFLKKNGSVVVAKMKNNVIEAEEKYYYDYNKAKLIYQLSFVYVLEGIDTSAAIFPSAGVTESLSLQ